MFYKDGILLRSDLFSDKVRHGFSGKVGGVSEHPYTASLNLAMGREDSDDVVRENIEIFARAVSGGIFGKESAVCAPQIHSDIVRRVTTADCGLHSHSPLRREGRRKPCCFRCPRGLAGNGKGDCGKGG